MTRFSHPLDQVRVAAPCAAGWERMTGNERVRFCAACNLNVYNLSAMTRADAERRIMTMEGRLCVRFYRRADGTILTQNCPTGLAALKRRVARVASGVLTAVLSFCAAVGFYSSVGVSVEPIPPMMEAMPQEDTSLPQPVRPLFLPLEAVTGQIAIDTPGRWVSGERMLPRVRAFRALRPRRKH